MAKFQWTGRSTWNRFKHKVAQEWFMLRLTFWSLVYNSLTSWGTFLDTALEPMFWFVDHFVRYLGPAFVVLVVALTTSVVVIFYTCLLPEKYNEYSWFWVIYHCVFGHWLLVNVVFHYFKAAFTSPGHPPEKVSNVVSICKKCIAPKPPRAHHCSVCNSCILKMDHHCPWLNNCVGHFNHRYFFLFCVYMWLGTVYVSISAYQPFKEHFYGYPNMTGNSLLQPLHLAKDALEHGGVKSSKLNEDSAKMKQPVTEIDKTSSSESPYRNTRGMYFHHYIMYEFMLCSAVAIALGLLTLWHARLIHKAETSIEVHINRKEKNRLKSKGLVFRNPYAFGTWNNWKRFLGITHGRTFWRHVLLPSSHPPDEDGIVWEMSTNVDASLFII